VHDFYSNNSSLFSSTRYAPWPGISRFIKNIDYKCNLVLDSGCGNGRNMLDGMFGVDYGINLLLETLKRTRKSTLELKGSKESLELISKNENIGEKSLEDKNNTMIKEKQNRNKLKSALMETTVTKPETNQGDEKDNLKNINLFRCTALNHPFKNETFDHILSIAVIHHFSTKERRIDALKDLYRLLKPQGTILLYVWSKHVSKQKKFEKIGDDENNDYRVIWNNDPTKIRYYYLYEINELKDDCISAGFIIKEINIEQESIKAILVK
jgi:tRNA (uracil-5-)-methyltransferase TRM9